MKNLLTLFMLLVPCVLRSGAQATDAPPAFDVAAIRPHDPAPHERSHIVSSDRDGNFNTLNVSLLAIVQYAFMTPDSRILNVPSWMKTQNYDIDAKSDQAVTERLSKLDWDRATPMKHAMIQALLEDRFKLKVHPESRELPIYQLVATKGGPKLSQSKAHGVTVDHGLGHLIGQGITVGGLAQELASDVGRVIVDKTGIDGQFDVDLKWARDDAAGTSDALPSLFTALEEQLGLRLVATKAPVDVLVIDHVEQPSEN